MDNGFRSRLQKILSQYFAISIQESVGTSFASIVKSAQLYFLLQFCLCKPNLKPF